MRVAAGWDAENATPRDGFAPVLISYTPHHSIPGAWRWVAMIAPKPDSEYAIGVFSCPEPDAPEEAFRQFSAWMGKHGLVASRPRTLNRY